MRDNSRNISGEVFANIFLWNSYKFGIIVDSKYVRQTVGSAKLDVVFSQSELS